MDLDDLYRILWVAHVRAQGVWDAIRDPLLILDEGLRIQSANPAYFEAFHANKTDTIGRLFVEVGEGQWNIPQLRRMIEDVITRSASVVDFEVRADFRGLGPRTMLISAQRVKPGHEAGHVILVTIVDATARRESEDRQDMHLGVLEHRLRNILSTVLGVVRQTEVQGRSAEQYRKALTGRLEAMGRALLASTDRATSEVAALVRSIMVPYLLDRRKVDIAGQLTVPLLAQHTLPLGLVLHELAKNAAEHGAFSVPDGSVAIRWDIETDGNGAQHLRLVWEERDGPLAAAPVSTGFGLRLIRFTVERELAGRVELNWFPQGLRATVSFPLETGVRGMPGAAAEMAAPVPMMAGRAPWRI